MKSFVSFQRVTFEWPNGEHLFKNVSFSLEQVNTALIGPNGLGKSTLCDLIVGTLQPSFGTIHRLGDQFYYQHQQVKPSGLIVNQYLETQGYEWFRFSETLLEGIDRNLFCDQLSGGQWMRVRLAAVLGDRFIILDEPTNDLDRNSRDILYDFLKQHRSGSLIISHDRECLKLCDSILELSKQGLSKYGMNWASYQESKNLERGALKKNLDRAEKERESAYIDRHEKIQRQEKRNQQGKREAAKGGMPKILIGGRKRRAQVSTGKVDTSTLEAVEIKVSAAAEAFNEIKNDPVMYFDLLDLSIPEGKLVAEARNFNIRFDRQLYPKSLNFTWRGNIRIAIKGANGSGKSSLLKCLLGEKLNVTGELIKGGLNIFYMDQNCRQLKSELSILENIQLVSAIGETEIRNNLAQFLFFKEKVYQNVGTLSGGERLRATLALACLQSCRPELMILDEPTNNLDLANIQFLEQLIQVFKGAVIVVSHDSTFIENCKLDQELCL